MMMLQEINMCLKFMIWGLMWPHKQDYQVEILQTHTV